MASGWRRRTVAVVVAVVASAGGWVASASARVFGPLEIVNVHSRLCLVVPGGRRAPATGLIQWGCNAAYNDQQWVEDDYHAAGPPSSGFALVRFRNVHTGLCLELPSDFSPPGVELIQGSCRAYPEDPFASGNDYWDVSPADHDGRRTLTSSYQGNCIGVPGASRSWGAKVIQWPCPPFAPDHFWYLRPVTSRLA